MHNSAYSVSKENRSRVDFEEFEKRKNEGSLRHVGLSESMHFIASQLGWHLEKTEDKIEPVISERTLQTESLMILSGNVAGVRQTGRAWMNGEGKDPSHLPGFRRRTGFV
jgi:4-hydroxy-tetrahydrodipicolinate reductase